MPAIRDLGEDGEEAASSTLRDLRDVVSPEVPGESRIIEAARIKATHPMAYPDAFAAATAIAHDATLWTGYPCGSTRPNASNLNYTAGVTIPNNVIVKLGVGGTVCLYSLQATHLIADINGAFAGTGYTTLDPARLLDTRPDGATIDNLFHTGVKVGAGGEIALQVTGRGGVPVDASAVVLNVTVTDPEGSGFVTVYPCGSTRPNASNLNYTAGVTIPNNVIVKLGVGGTVCLYSLQATHLIADINGALG